MDYMICVRNKKGSGFGQEPGPTRYLAVPPQAKNPKLSHAISRGQRLEVVERQVRRRGASRW